jgi:hypothetical protein
MSSVDNMLGRQRSNEQLAMPATSAATSTLSARAEVTELICEFSIETFIETHRLNLSIARCLRSNICSLGT